ncbi:ACR3 family arsenite efflux transporter [Marinospirillum perlucidum]|uniref:ACR3 family arsenite efflux transporter n=1 Tax=Marinospirillum perlucidum TaxID=1982602 RepID=UPI000DF49385|nr:ACR3 family arsenite efflux transporter [Marinospirillum perlucidum]
MGLFERFLSIWVALAILAGLFLGEWMPQVFEVIAGLTYFHVNLAVAVFIWAMIYPMMVQIDFQSLKNVGRQPQGLFLTLVINWLVKPFTMAALGWLFFRVFFAEWVDPATASEFIAGMILLGVAPCTAMVFVWSHLTRGNSSYTLVQVSINDIIMIFAFAPLAALLLGLSSITVPWETLVLSVLLYVATPLLAGLLTRRQLLKSGREHLDAWLKASKPATILGLLATVVLLFGLQADRILTQPFSILLIAIPLLIQSYMIFFLAYWVAKRMQLPHSIAAPASLIGTSNFFELAVAVAISLFGLTSPAALATVVGVLVEVPVMLSLVAFANRTRHWFPSETASTQV